MLLRAPFERVCFRPSAPQSDPIPEIVRYSCSPDHFFCFPCINLWQNVDSKSENNLFVACYVVQLKPTDYPNATKAQLVILCNKNNNSLLDYYYCVVLIPVIIGFCILEFCVAYDCQKFPSVRASLQYQCGHPLQNYPQQDVQQKGDCCFSVFLSARLCYCFVDVFLWWWWWWWCRFKASPN